MKRGEAGTEEPAVPVEAPEEKPVVVPVVTPVVAAPMVVPTVVPARVPYTNGVAAPSVAESPVV